MKKILLRLFILTAFFQDLNSQGNFIKSYGDFTGQGNCVIADKQGNYLLAGHRFLNNASKTQFQLQKIDRNGNSVWFKWFGGILDDYANEVTATNDGGFALIGTTNISSGKSRITFIKLNSSCDSSWTKSYGGLTTESGASIIQIVSGHYFIGGSFGNQSTNGLDFWLIKTDSNGDTIWTRKYGGSKNDRMNAMAICADGGVVMTGYTYSFGAGTQDYYVVKVNGNGVVQWTKTYGFSGIAGYTCSDFANSVKQTPDGGFVVVGCANWDATYGNIYVVRTNYLGDTLWTRKLAIDSSALTANDVICTKDGGFAIAGERAMWKFTTNSSSFIRGDAYVLKLNSIGEVKGTRQFNIDTSNTCVASAGGSSIIQLDDESCVIGGSFFDCSTQETMLIKTFDIGPAALPENTSNGARVFPVPALSKVTLQFNNLKSDCLLTLFNSKSETVLARQYQSVSLIEIERNGLAAGLYYFRVTDKSGHITCGKVVFE